MIGVIVSDLTRDRRTAVTHAGSSKGQSSMQFFRARTLAAPVLAAALLVASAGCSSSKSDGTQSSGKMDKVTYVTAFGNFGRDSFVWEAKEKGYFKQAGIDVQVVPGNGADNGKDLATGKAQFAIIDFASAVLQMTKSKLDIRAVAAINQTSLMAFMALPGSSVKSPQDLAGKKIAIQPGGVEQTLFPSYAKLAGFDPSHVQFVTSSPATLPQELAQHQVDAISQFVVGVPTVETATKNQSLTVLPWSKYIGDLYGNTLFTSQSLIQKNPGLVTRFETALLKGLNDSLNDPAGAAKALQKNVPTANVANAEAELKLMKQYCQGPDGLGALDQSQVAKMVGILQASGAVSAQLTPDDLADFKLAPNADKQS
ncbi:ABC transporter substrate-binding protein [Rugosimonospora acidiphila]